MYTKILSPFSYWGKFYSPPLYIQEKTFCPPCEMMNWTRVAKIIEPFYTFSMGLVLQGGFGMCKKCQVSSNFGHSHGGAGHNHGGKSNLSKIKSRRQKIIAPHQTFLGQSWPKVRTAYCYLGLW